jgi:hypothetical protein
MWWLLLVPFGILALLIFSGVMLAAGAISLLGAAWPVLLIGLGVWLFCRDGRRERHHRRDRARWTGQPHTRRDKRTAAPLATGQATTRALVTDPPRASELPIDLQVKVEQIRSKVEVLLGFADRFPPFSQDLYLVRQTASDYLPRTIETFLSLPRVAVDKPMSATGKTPRQELRAQLDLLDAKLDEIALDLERQDTDRLLANRRFLEQRFGQRAEDRPDTAKIEVVA